MASAERTSARLEIAVGKSVRGSKPTRETRPAHRASGVPRWEAPRMEPVTHAERLEEPAQVVAVLSGRSRRASGAREMTGETLQICEAPALCPGRRRASRRFDPPPPSQDRRTSARGPASHRPSGRVTGPGHRLSPEFARAPRQTSKAKRKHAARPGSSVSGRAFMISPTSVRTGPVAYSRTSLSNEPCPPRTKGPPGRSRAASRDEEDDALADDPWRRDGYRSSSCPDAKTAGPLHRRGGQQVAVLVDQNAASPERRAVANDRSRSSKNCTQASPSNSRVARSSA